MQTKKKKVEKEISDHFKKLGQKSWEARKAKLLDKKDEPVSK